jgi:hypothetical protein
MGDDLSMLCPLTILAIVADIQCNNYWFEPFPSFFMAVIEELVLFGSREQLWW